MSCLLGSTVANFNLTLADPEDQDFAENPYPSVDIGYWTAFSDRLSVYKCMASTNGSCRGGLAGACDGGHVGFLCGECPPGMIHHEGACKPCTEWGRSGIATIVIILMVVIIVAYYVSNGEMYVNSTFELVLASMAGMGVTMLQIIAMCDSLTVPWQRTKETQTVMSVASPFGEDLGVFGVQCVLGHDPLVSFFLNACIPAFIVLFVYTCHMLSKMLPRISHRLEKWNTSKTWNTLGTIYLVLFITMLTVCCRPLSMYEHPNGQMSVVMYPTVLVGSRDHWLQLAVSLAVFLFMLLPFAVGSVYGEYVAGAHTQSDRMTMHVRTVLGDNHLVRFRFLFYRFRPAALWWGSVLLLRQSLLALAPSIPASYPHLQVGCASGVLIVYGVSASAILPWKSSILNTLDVCQSVCLSIFLLTSTAFMDRAQTGKDLYTCLLITELSVAALTLVLGHISLLLTLVLLFWDFDRIIVWTCTNRCSDFGCILSSQFSA